jgi:hypothetical protein
MSREAWVKPCRVSATTSAFLRDGWTFVHGELSRVIGTCQAVSPLVHLKTVGLRASNRVSISIASAEAATNDSGSCILSTKHRRWVTDAVVGLICRVRPAVGQILFRALHKLGRKSRCLTSSGYHHRNLEPRECYRCKGDVENEVYCSRCS